MCSCTGRQLALPELSISFPLQLHMCVAFPWPHAAPLHLQEDVRQMNWLPSVAAVEELVLCLAPTKVRGAGPSHEELLELAKAWVRWAAGSPRLRRLELRVGDSQDMCSLEGTRGLCAVARAEGEGAEAVVGQMLALLPGALPR